MALVLWLVALSLSNPAAQTLDPASVREGQRIYDAEKCSACHQVAGRGNKRFPLDGVGTRLPAADIRRWFTHTVEMEARLPTQPAIKLSAKKFTFTPAELDALVAYLRSLK